jgi:hypothetical protein
VPEAKYGFPGLAGDLRELPWLEANAAAVEASDWLGAHAYWSDEREMLDPQRALAFVQYHRRFPRLPVVVTEAGNRGDLSTTDRARQYARFVRVLARLPYVRGVHFFILSGSGEWRRFFFDQTMVFAVRRAATDPLPAFARLLGFAERSRRARGTLAGDEPGDLAGPLPTPTWRPQPTPTPEPFFRRRLLADPQPAAVADLAAAPAARWARLGDTPAPAAAFRTASSYTVTDAAVRLSIAPPLPGQPFALQLAEADLFGVGANSTASARAGPTVAATASPGGADATGFALLWDGDLWRLQYWRDGRLAADQVLQHVPDRQGADWLRVEFALEPRSAAAWIWSSGQRQPDLPNAVFAPPEAAAADGARARALFLPAHPVADVVLEGATRYT